MANEPGVTLPSIADPGNFVTAPGGRPDPPPAWTAPNVFDFIGEEIISGVVTSNPAPTAALQRNFASLIPTIEIGTDFFEKIILIPESIDAGIVVSVLNFFFDVYSSYRKEVRSFESFVSTAGAGISITDLPPFPDIMPAQSGFALTLEVLPDGPPNIVGDLIFGFDVLSVSVPITGLRAVTIPFEPEVPIVEILEWVTRVLQSANGEEQRSGLREVPRSIIEMNYRTTGSERQRLETLIFDGQDRVFGLPLFYKQTEVTAPISITDTVISVRSTAGLELATGIIGITWVDSALFEELQIQSFTATTVTFSSPFTKAFPLGSIFMPMRSAVTKDPVRRGRFLNEVQDHHIRFQVVDNGPSLADTSPYSSYTPTGGTTRVLLDDPNLVDSSKINEELRRLITVTDNKTAFPLVFTSQDVSRETMQKGFFSRSVSDLEDIRGLLHALSGRRVSFYIPTEFPDFELLASVAPSDQSITVTDIEYVNFVKQRQARNVLRLVSKDGTISAPKLITGSSKPTAGQETISIAPDTFGVTIALADILRAEYVQKVRIDTDRIQIKHLDPAGKATVFFPIVTVLEPDDV